MVSSEVSAESNTAPLLKDHINPQNIRLLAELIKQYQPVFPTENFIKLTTHQLDAMPLKTRVVHISQALATFLVDDYAENAKWLKQLADNWPDKQDNNGWHSFMAWPLIDYAGKQGLRQPEVALDLLKQLTSLFTAEFSIRPYIEAHFELTYRHLVQWCNDPDEHVRRLASEGIRPRLPWGGYLKALQRDPQPIFALLTQLKDDNSHYVQKSVANNLNDISKDHPQRVIALCREWINDATPQRRWIIRHGLRSLIKAGEPAVFPLLGYSDNPAVKVELSLSKQQVSLGQNVGIEATIVSMAPQPQTFVVDYRVWHMKANGKATAKVFKWKNVELRRGEQISLSKSHGFLSLTTRRYYSGRHTIELLINGVGYAQADIELLIE